MPGRGGGGVLSIGVVPTILLTLVWKCEDRVGQGYGKGKADVKREAPHW